MKPGRADADLYGIGKISDQVWSGINAARVLVAELTGKNANVPGSGSRAPQTCHPGVFQPNWPGFRLASCVSHLLPRVLRHLAEPRLSGRSREHPVRVAEGTRTDAFPGVEITDG